MHLWFVRMTCISSYFNNFACFLEKIVFFILFSLSEWKHKNVSSEEKISLAWLVVPPNSEIFVCHSVSIKYFWINNEMLYIFKRFRFFESKKIICWYSLTCELSVGIFYTLKHFSCHFTCNNLQVARSTKGQWLIVHGTISVTLVTWCHITMVTRLVECHFEVHESSDVVHS